MNQVENISHKKKEKFNIGLFTASHQSCFYHFYKINCRNPKEPVRKNVSWRLLFDFLRASLILSKVSDLTEKLEERMYQIYNHHNKIIQEKLQEFTQKMAKISHLETELKQVCHTVETVYKDLCVQPEVWEL